MHIRRIEFEKERNQNKNKIVEFLWYFEHIDGCQDLQKFEITRVTREPAQWCRSTGLSYTLPEIYP